MSTIAQVLAAAPSLVRLQKPNPKGRATRNQGTEATMAWLVEIDEAADALGVIGGTVETVTIFGQSLSRIVPLHHPVYDWLIADAVDWEDCGWEGGVGGTASETHTRITVTFRSPSFGLDGTMPYVEFSGQSSPRVIPAPQNAFKAGHMPAMLDYGEQANGADFSLTLHQMPGLNLGLWVASANTTNSTTFLGAPAGTLIFLGPSWSMSQQLGNVQSWKLGLGFKITDPNHPWNYGYLLDGSWGLIQKPDDSLQYPAIDFNTLFVQ